MWFCASMRVYALNVVCARLLVRCSTHTLVPPFSFSRVSCATCSRVRLWINSLESLSELF